VAALSSSAGVGILFRIGGPVFLVGVFAPALIAIALTARSHGRSGVAALLAQIGRWRVDGRWYAFALGYFAAIELTAALIQRLTTGTWPTFGDTPLVVILGAILVSSWVQAGEELGWRGYALPRLARRLGLGGASIVLGVTWAVWHVPLFFMAGSGSDGQSFPVYLLHVVALSITLAWLYWRTARSLLLVMVMHASINNTTGIVSSTVPEATDVFTLRGSREAWITVLLLWIVAAGLLYRMRGATLEGRDKKVQEENVTDA
jgi:membrane protease YdiL (CAAX protease family)